MSAHEHNQEFMTTSEGATVIQGVGFPGASEAHQVVLKDGRVHEIVMQDGPVQWIGLPPLSDVHMHANRAFTIPGKRPENFEDAINMTLQLFEGFTTNDYARQARRLFERAFHHGTTYIRTHADLDHVTGLKSVNGTLKAISAVEDKMDIDVVAFASSQLDPVLNDASEMLTEAIQAGATYLGATPVLYDQPHQSMEALVKLAAELNVPIDFHLDEHLDEHRFLSEDLTSMIIDHQMEGQVTISHGCALSVLDSKRLARVIDRMLATRVTVVVLPLTNLYLQDRFGGDPKRRGLAPILELLRAGVPVLIGTDNVQDAFYPFGDADLLDTAYIGMIGGHLDNSRALVQTICNGRHAIEVGDTDFVLIKGQSFDHVLSTRPGVRKVFRKGIPIA